MQELSEKLKEKLKSDGYVYPIPEDPEIQKRVQEIERGKDEYLIIPGAAELEDIEVVFNNNSFLPDRIADNFTAIWADIIKTAKEENITAADLMREFLGGEFNEDGYPTDNKHRAIVERAENKSITVSTKIEKIDYPTDKINNNVWKKFLYADKNGQFNLDNFECDFVVGKKETALAYYSINFTELENVVITKNLTSYDKRVYIAVGALYNLGYVVMTIQQIYNAMGYIDRPNARDRKKINDSITKMNIAHIFINNNREIQVHKKQKLFFYDGSLLPMERLQAVVNGKVTDEDGGIHLLREPPLISFARGRKQITTINRRLLESPLSKTEENLTLDDYLIENISYIKHGKGDVNNKMLYSTIFDKCGIKDKVKQHRAKEKIEKYLDHYTECGFITKHEKKADGVVIYY